MAALLALPIIFVIVDGAIIGLTTLGWAMLAVAMCALDYGISQGIVGAIGSQSGFAPLVNSLALQLSSQQVQQLAQNLLPQLSQPTQVLPSHTLPSRQLPDRAIPNRQTPLQLMPNPPTQPNPPQPTGPTTLPNPPTQPNPPQPPAPTNSDPVTCTQVTAAAQNLGIAIAAGENAAAVQIAAAVNNLLGALTGAGSPLAALGAMLPQLMPILASLNLTEITKDLDTLAGCVCPSLNAIATAISKGAPMTAVENLPLWNQLVKEGAVSGAVGQLADPWPFDQIISTIASVAKYFGGELGQVETGFGLLLQNVIEPWLTKALGLVESNADSFLAIIQPYVTKYAPIVSNLARTVVNDAASVETTLPMDLFNLVVAALVPPAGVTPDNVEAFTFKMLGLAFIAGQAIHLLAGLAGFLGYPMSSIWGNNARMIIDLLAYDAIREALHGSFFAAAIETPARQHYNQQFRTGIMPMGLAARLVARRMAPLSRYQEIAALNGLNAADEALLEPNIYRPTSSRLMATAWVNMPFPTAQVTHMLQDQGYSDADVQTMLAALEYKAISALANSYMEEVLAAYGEGAISDADLSDAFTNAGWSTQAQALATQRAAIIRQRNLIKETTANYTASVYDGQITPAQFEGFLQAAGAQDWKVQLELGFASTRAALKAYVKAEALAAKELTAEENALTKSYLAEYQQGNLTTAELTAALIAIPRPAATVAAIVTNAENTQVGRSKYLYGKLMTPQAAKTLGLLVTALRKQFVATFLTADQFKAALVNAGIDETDAQVIVASAAAGVIAVKGGSQNLPT